MSQMLCAENKPFQPHDRRRGIEMMCQQSGLSKTKHLVFVEQTTVLSKTNNLVSLEDQKSGLSKTNNLVSRRHKF